MWGSCFVAIDWGLRDAPVLWFAAFRSLLAGAVLVIIAFAAMFAAAAALSAGVGSVLSNAQPLLILLPAWWLFGERPRRSTGAAVAIGFIGLAITASTSIGTTSGAALALLAAAAITTGTIIARRMHDVDVVAVLAFLAVVGTAGAFVLWFTEVRRAPLATVALWTFLTPVFGLSFGAIVLRQYPSGRELVGIALVLAGLAGGLAWPARNPRNNNDRLRLVQTENALGHVASVKPPHERVDAGIGL